MIKIVYLRVLFTFLFINISCGDKAEPQVAVERMDWWRQSRFGLFIHWGLYSIPAGEWNGNPNHDVLIRETGQITLEDYNEYLKQFNPERFNAEDWVLMAKNAGMKYIVITAKHHDGFCLFDSQETEFDIASTPFKRDILKELSDACLKHEMALGFYYSIMDWHHPHYLPRRKWEKNRPAEGADMKEYTTYMKKQLKELLTKYDNVAVLWFDGEWEKTWTHEDGEDLYKYLRALKPGLIINNRVDKGRTDNGGISKDSTFYGDFGTPEQEIPINMLKGMDWESCMTMNDHWVYNKSDQNWKSSESLIHKLIDISAKGGNFLLNVGPTAEGLFPGESVERLKEIGDWMKVNGEAIYNTKAGPFQQLPWGRSTQKKVDDHKTVVYLHVFDWPDEGELSIPLLENTIMNAYSLHDKKNISAFGKTRNGILIKTGGVVKSKYATVIAIEMEGVPVVKD
ncbi:alpha-L-fucosidase [Agriterribacter sp.]|uniref:alpha-L-fucosidase n=1 Tax=Agriterribacter sp. TaxID=2821509 RepID=UPI002C2038D8|nr:alpha-L-fucosidase [Agriterribacter sp.]HTN08224.1 alpha-L-fucosidase [Agriterribacter sp.]